MLDKNNFWIGAIIGFIFPFFGFVPVYFLFDIIGKMGVSGTDLMDFNDVHDRSTICILSLCFNIILIKKYNTPFMQSTLKGILVATMILAFAWLLIFWKSLIV